MNTTIHIDSKKRNPGLTLLFHIGGWGIFILLPVLFGWSWDSFHMKRVLTQMPLLMLFFYLNYYIFIPQFFTSGKYWWYVAIALLSLCVISYLYEMIDHLHRMSMPPLSKELEAELRRSGRPMGAGRHHFRVFSFPGFFSGLVAFAIGISIRITNEWLKNERQRKELENQTLKSELSFLKSQVNPHFLFNTLNNIYSLSLGKSEQTPEAIMKLSQLLRYMLYETDDKGVSLEREVAYLDDYISLQKMRVSDQVQITFEKQGDLHTCQIAPLILIPFVENAFKHGIHVKHSSYIKILLVVDGTRLNFQVVNSIPPNATELPKDKASGIGLTNVAKRLNLLYPDRHRLEIKTTDNEYIVLLQLNLS